MIAKHQPTRSEQFVITSADLDSAEVQQALSILDKQVATMTLEEQRARDLYAVQSQIEDYLVASVPIHQIKTVGDFLRLYLETLNINPVAFAQYIGWQLTEVEALLKGGAIDAQRSFILGKLFQIDPEYWMQIQTKNEYLQFKYSASAPIEKEYSLAALLNPNPSKS